MRLVLLLLELTHRIFSVENQGPESAQSIQMMKKMMTMVIVALKVLLTRRTPQRRIEAIISGVSVLLLLYHKTTDGEVKKPNLTPFHVFQASIFGHQICITLLFIIPFVFLCSMPDTIASILFLILIFDMTKPDQSVTVVVTVKHQRFDLSTYIRQL